MSKLPEAYRQHIRKDAIMEQSVENTDSHSHPKTQTESDAIRTMLQHALELDDVGFYEEAFLSEDTIAFVIPPEAIVDEDE